MILNANELISAELLESDICIMGAGVAGITLAVKLLDSGKRVILLDAGVESFDPDVQSQYSSESQPKYFPDTMSSRLRMLGGSSNHWENSTERLDPLDLSSRDWVPDSGWPIDYAELKRFYPEAEAFCGLDNKGYDFTYWREKLNLNDKLLNSETLETAIFKAALPPVRFFEKFGVKLKESNSATVITSANVIDLNYIDGKVSSVLISNKSKITSTIKAKHFVMCFGGIENARMLLHINQKNNNQLGNQFDNVGRYFMEHPTIRAAHFLPFNGALNGVFDGVVFNQQLLRARFKLTEKAQLQHEVNNMRLILTKASNMQLSSGIRSSHIISDSMKGSEIPDQFGTHLMNIIKDIDLIGEQYLRKEFNYTLFEEAHQFGGYQFVSMIEQTPERTNRIELGEETDKYGIKRVKISWAVSEYDISKTWESLKLLSKDPVLNQFGRVRLLSEGNRRVWSSQLGFGQHHMGTTRMSESEKTGVVDSSCRVFGTSNLYIAGSSVFPTGGHVPPTLTIIAMAIRLAEKLKKVF
jgi:choline dehydrogenase-like flavoprotein